MFTLGTTPSFLFKAFKATTKILKLQQNSNKTTRTSLQQLKYSRKSSGNHRKFIKFLCLFLHFFQCAGKDKEILKLREDFSDQEYRVITRAVCWLVLSSPNYIGDCFCLVSDLQQVGNMEKPFRQNVWQKYWQLFPLSHFLSLCLEILGYHLPPSLFSFLCKDNWGLPLKSSTTRKKLEYFEQVWKLFQNFAHTRARLTEKPEQMH